MRKVMNRLICMVFLSAMMLVSVSAYAGTESPQATLQQYIADLQNNPNDNALREKIIKLALEAKNPLALPGEARQHLMMAQAFLKKAKNEVGYKLAIDEYKQALLLAPWLPEAYNNLGVLYEKVGNYDEAASNLKLYLLTNPADAQKAQDMLIEIEATKKLASAEATQQKAQEEKAKSKTIEGVWDMTLQGRRMTGIEPLRISKENGQWVVDDGMGKSFYNSHVVATDTTVSFDRDTYESPELNHVHVDVRLSEDGTKLTGTYTTVDVSSTPQSQTEPQEYWRR